MVYTMHQDPAVDQVINQHLKHMAHKILDEHGDVTSLILIGGFGRGEGSVINSEGRYQPLNDYDLVIVERPDTSTNTCGRLSELISERFQIRSHPRETLRNFRSLEERLARDIGIRHVDFFVMKRSDLARLKPTVFNYDLKYGSRVIYGDQGVLERIPKISPESLNHREARIQLFTHMFCLLESFRPNGEDLEDRNDQGEFMIHQAMKAVIAAGTSLLLMRRKYEMRYRARLQRLQSEFPDRERLKQLFSQAVEFKLQPDYTLFPKPMVLWQEARLALQEAFTEYFSKTAHKKILSWKHLCDHYERQGNKRLRIIGHKILGTYPLYLNLRNMELAGLCLIQLLDQKPTDSELLTRFQHYMTRVVPFKRIASNDIEMLRKEYVEIWYEKLFANRL